MQAWKTRSRKLILNREPWLTVEDHEVELPDGRIIPDWLWVQSPDYVNVVVQIQDGKFLLFRQTKYALEGDSLALVGGYIQPGEEPLAAAQRELLEETGFSAPEWTSLGRFRVDPNRGVAEGFLFLAQQAVKTAQPIPDDLEEQHPVLLTRDELGQALDRGEIKVLAWAAAVAFAFRQLS